jgi:hypothetical protein
MGAIPLEAVAQRAAGKDFWNRERERVMNGYSGHRPVQSVCHKRARQNRPARVLVGAPLSGRAPPTEGQALVPANLDLQSRHPHSVGVVAAGREKTDPFLASTTSNGDFVRALCGSIARSGSFGAIIMARGADYRLDVPTIRCDGPRPLRRRVALKVIKPGMDTKEVSAALNDLALTLASQTKLPGAEAVWREALACRRTLLAREPSRRPASHRFLLQSFDSLALTLVDEQKFAAAERFQWGALEIGQTRLPDDWLLEKEEDEPCEPRLEMVPPAAWARLARERPAARSFSFSLQELARTNPIRVRVARAPHGKPGRFAATIPRDLLYIVWTAAPAE